jgi:hypothetical protein
LVEAERVQGTQRQALVAFVRRVEGAAEQADGDAAVVTEARRCVLPAQWRAGQGRSWPWPMTS